MHLKKSSAKLRPFCLGPIVLKYWHRLPYDPNLIDVFHSQSHLSFNLDRARARGSELELNQGRKAVFSGVARIRIQVSHEPIITMTS